MKLEEIKDTFWEFNQSFESDGAKVGIEPVIPNEDELWINYVARRPKNTFFNTLLILRRPEEHPDYIVAKHVGGFDEGSPRIYDAESLRNLKREANALGEINLEASLFRDKDGSFIPDIRKIRQMRDAGLDRYVLSQIDSPGLISTDISNVPVDKGNFFYRPRIHDPVSLGLKMVNATQKIYSDPRPAFDRVRWYENKGILRQGTMGVQILPTADIGLGKMILLSTTDKVDFN